MTMKFGGLLPPYSIHGASTLGVMKEPMNEDHRKSVSRIDIRVRGKCAISHSVLADMPVRRQRGLATELLRFSSLNSPDA